jgi:hypothetical protein
MENSPYAQRLRYLDAADVDDAVADFAGMDVYGSDGHRIGDVDGFIIDSQARRVNYVVIDSGGWFTSRHLLMPVGHASLGADRKSLQADVTREALQRMPEFDADRFARFSDAELRAFERDTVIACCPDEPLEAVLVTTWAYDSRRHYTQPDWWRHSRYAPERLRDVWGSAADATAPQPRTSIRDSAASAAGDSKLATAREAQAAGEMSPHPGGRAQPGDVLGIETGGEVTAIGDTAEDENRRREAAERASEQTRSRPER